MVPPARYADSTFAAYVPQTQSQHDALDAARAFVAHLQKQSRRRLRLGRALRRRSRAEWKGLYLVGPVGTGKTHLLAAMYFALHPQVPCAFMHSSELFRASTPPERYADELAAAYRVLCLDEVELDDPANEARLIVVLKRLERKGVILLATSNVEPERFLSTHLGNDRFRRFLNEEFRRHYRVVLVEGRDYRLGQGKSGRAWIGPAAVTGRRIEEVFREDGRDALWLPFEEFIELSSSTEHRRLIQQLSARASLYLVNIRIRDTDDALRLLRVVDDLYRLPAPPVVYYSSEQDPSEWFVAGSGSGGIEAGIAEKFSRTTSRLAAMCEIEDLRNTAPAGVRP